MSEETPGETIRQAVAYVVRDAVSEMPDISETDLTALAVKAAKAINAGFLAINLGALSVDPTPTTGS